jgi:hypothetical protein
MSDYTSSTCSISDCDICKDDKNRCQFNSDKMYVNISDCDLCNESADDSDTDKKQCAYKQCESYCWSFDYCMTHLCRRINCNQFNGGDHTYCKDHRCSFPLCTKSSNNHYVRYCYAHLCREIGCDKAIYIGYDPVGVPSTDNRCFNH